MTKILLVEDEALVAMLLEDMLADRGYTVVGPAATVSDALSLIDKHDFTCAILDVNLGNQTSYPIADTLRERQIPYVFGTGYGAAGVDDAYRDAPVLRKPFDEGALVRALDQAMQRRT